MKRSTKRWGLVFYGVELYEVFTREEDAQAEADKRNKKIGDRVETWEALPVTVYWDDRRPR